MRGGPGNRCSAMRGVAAGIAALALGLGGCGGDDETSAKSGTAAVADTTTQPTRTTRTQRPAVKAPEVPAETARDVAAVRGALNAADYTVKQSKFPGTPLAQLEVGTTLVAFYASADDAAKSAAGLKKAFDKGSGRGAVRASGKRLYTVSQKDKLSGADRDRFAKIISTSEGAL